MARHGQGPPPAREPPLTLLGVLADHRHNSLAHFPEP